MESIHQLPDFAAFSSYADYLAQTPETFSLASGTPILFRHFVDAKLRIFQSNLIQAPLLAPFMPSFANGQESATTHQPNRNEEADEAVEFEVSGMQIWAASDYLYLYFPSASQPGGVRIPHPLISLHAISPSSPPSIYLQLESSDAPHDDYDSESTIELSLIPPPTLHPPGAPPSSTEEAHLTPTQALYDALRVAADMWAALEDEDGVGGLEMVFSVSGNDEAAGDDAVAGLPPPISGSGGWITSDNVGEFFDEEGNWRGREAGTEPHGANGLGEGAGVVRAREYDHRNGETEGVDGNGEDSKRRRID